MASAHARFDAGGARGADCGGVDDGLVADCEGAETFGLSGVVGGAEFRGVEVLLVAAVAEVLEVSATHVVVIVVVYCCGFRLCG